MLTVDFSRLAVEPGLRVLDLGCGRGRHAFEAWRRGATVVAFDRDRGELADVRDVVAAMADAGELAAGGAAGGTAVGDAGALPFPDGAFDVVIAAEVLEHVAPDRRAIAELTRVLRPGGRLAVTVPAEGPERVCWALDHRYHDRPGGHVRIYSKRELVAKLRAAGLSVVGTERVHALHAPYWWLRCALGVDRDQRAPVRHYHQLLVWQIVHRPKASPAARWLDALERACNPFLGKSLVVYAERA